MWAAAAIVLIIISIGFVSGWYMCHRSSTKVEKDDVNTYMSQQLRRVDRDAFITEYVKTKFGKENPEKEKMSHVDHVDSDDHDDNVLKHSISVLGKDEKMSAFDKWKTDVENNNLQYWDGSD
jgi:hypothetical protein